MNETQNVTRILKRLEAGDTFAAEELPPLMYDELRRVASEKLAKEEPGQTLEATRFTKHGCD